ncbi:MAG: TolC family protein [Mariprofundaceae bacterium]
MLLSLRFSARTHLAALMLAGLTFPALLQAEPMSLEEVIAEVLKHHPDLAVSRVDSDIARTEIQSTEGLLDPTVTASISAIQDKNPVSNSFQASKTQRGQLAAGISQPLASGGTLSANAAFNSAKQTFSNPVAASFSLINPEYRNQIDVSYRHPLIKGADRPDYHYSLIAADAGYEAARLNQSIIAHNLTLQAINRYYQLASDDINIRIAEAAVQRAGKLLSYQHSRERFGLIEASDRLQAEALLAARQTALAQARARRASDLTALNRLMLRNPMQPIKAITGLHFPANPPRLNEALDSSRQLRPEFRALDARLKAAEAKLETARDQDQMQLDLVAQLGTRTLDGKAAMALKKSVSIHDHFASLSLEMSDVLNRNRPRASLRKAELARDRIVRERIQLQEIVRNDLANAITTINSGLPALAAAEAQADIEKKKFRAEMRKYREGRSDTTTLVQFEGDLSNAELQAELQRLNLELADRQLAWAQGRLQGQSDRDAGSEAKPG